MPMEYDEIQTLLPHASPFVLLDRVLQINSKSILAIKNISGSELFSQAHFPGKAIYPGVLLIEIAAQAAALLMQHVSSRKEKNTMVPLLGGIQNFQFLKPVKPGDRLYVQVSFMKQVQHLAVVKSEIRCDGYLMARGQLSVGEKRNEEI